MPRGDIVDMRLLEDVLDECDGEVEDVRRALEDGVCVDELLGE